MRERSRLRIGESLSEAGALRKEVEAWRSGWDAVDAIGGHLSHLDVLCTVISGLIDEITRRMEAIEPAIETGAVYEECRREDLRLLYARRLWRWYADKLDQRARPEDTIEVQTLLAADEVVWSCWKTAFNVLGGAAPPAPIPYLATLYSATATPRTDPPPDLRPGEDDLLRKHVERLPIATVALPPVCCRRPWWIVLGAHEASHHIQFESDGLEDLTQQRVVAAAYSCINDTEIAEAWRPWCRELFADACSVLLVGSAAIWAVAELEMRTQAGLRKSPSGTYPPPIIRLAVLRDVAERGGIPVRKETLVGLTDPSAEDDDRIRQLLACVPGVAAALTLVGPEYGQTLGALADMTSRAYAEGGSVSAWRSELLGPGEPLPHERLDAARFCISAGVDAWERFGGQGGLAERLADRLRRLLPRCREPGKRAVDVIPDADSVTRQLIADLYLDDTGGLFAVRVLLDLRARGGADLVCVTAWDDQARERKVRWAGTGFARILVRQDDPLGDDEADKLASQVDQGNAATEELRRYGGLLFEAAFGEAVWRELIERSASEPYVELAIRGRADQEKPTACPLQTLRWEALHDGTTFVAAKGVTALQGTTVPVGIVRLVPPAPGAAGQEPLTPIYGIPRVLFAVGSRLTDPKVRPGAEFMGILRQMERRGGSVQPRVLEFASLESLKHELQRFQPDVLHLIGHGRWVPADHCVKVQLRQEASGGDNYVAAGELLAAFSEAGHVPTVVVLSACQTASSPPSNSDQAPTPVDPVGPLPFAARLVAGGVSVVAAMAGDISDTACRIFTRALTKAIGEGKPLGRAVILGRQAAFYQRSDPGSADWIMPVLFLAEHVPGETCLVDTTSIAVAKSRIQLLDLAWEPVFCGRGEFIAAMDRLLDDTDPLNVLVAYTADPDQSYGGMRLLRELAARAVRSGRLPVLLGPFDKDPPTDRREFAAAFSDKLTEIRTNLGLADKPSRFVTAAVDPDKKPIDLARAIRADLDELEQDLPDSDPVRASPHPRTVLLCHRVDRWLDALDDLLRMMGSRGLGPGRHPLPLVITGADTAEQGRPLQAARSERSGAAWIKFTPLGRFRDDKDDPEDILVYQWWLLNPPEGTPVYAPKRGCSTGWRSLLRLFMKNCALYDEQALFGFADAAADYFTKDMDNDVLTSFAKVAP